MKTFEAACKKFDSRESSQSAISKNIWDSTDGMQEIVEHDNFHSLMAQIIMTAKEKADGDIAGMVIDAISIALQAGIIIGREMEKD